MSVLEQVKLSRLSQNGAYLPLTICHEGQAERLISSAQGFDEGAGGASLGAAGDVDLDGGVVEMES